MDNIHEDEQICDINANLSVIQKKTGLKFGTDSYLLSAFVSGKYVKGADLGSGTGVASLICTAADKIKTMYSFEIQNEYASLISRNAQINGLSGKIIPIQCDIREIESYAQPGTFDAVISNPPYFKNGSGFHSTFSDMDIARREINGTINDFCNSASKLLKFGGDFYVIYRPERLSDLLDAMKSAMLEPKKMILIFPNIDSSPSLVLVKAVKGASPELVISRPLIMKDNDNKETDDCAKIYSNCSTNFLFDRNNKT